MQFLGSIQRQSVWWPAGDVDGSSINFTENVTLTQITQKLNSFSYLTNSFNSNVAYTCLDYMISVQGRPTYTKMWMMKKAIFLAAVGCMRPTGHMSCTPS